MNDKVSRRELLSQAGRTAAAASIVGTTAGALTAAPARAQEASGSKNDRLVGALIGCGGMGQGNMTNFIGHGGVIAAVCDVDTRHMAAAAAEAEKRQGRAPDQIKDFRKVMERKDIDVVIIATPDHWHALPFIAAC